MGETTKEARRQSSTGTVLHGRLWPNTEMIDKQDLYTLSSLYFSLFFIALGMERPRRTYQSPITEKNELPCKKALLIGINYKTGKGSGNEQRELRTPHRDVHDMKDLLISMFP